ncbi:TetR/AcrR family transcriptional regulator [Nocardia sp. NPDC050406]|uniref:TetR/AcrR family transcriptional regulator n=1 Tax=Nocardia sp. NPDC050406 TaxID=3364318 RepID=UPI00379C77A2
MAGGRARMSRAESQQRTREEVLNAAEDLFLTYGLHGTTVAKIAAAAGRTQGAIYANFDSKENLCAEVLLRCYMRTFTALLGKMAGSPGALDRQLDSLVDWWKELIDDESTIALAAEYALAIHKNPVQLAVSQGHIEMARNMLGAALLTSLPSGVSAAQRELVMNALLSTGVGVALGRTLGVVDSHEAGELLIRTARLWLADLATGDATV